MAVNISLDGISELLKTLEDLGESIDKAADEGLKTAGGIIKDRAAENLQRSTPHHIGQTYFMKAPADNNANPIIKGLKISKVINGKNGKYIKVYNSFPAAPLVEYGHSGNLAPAHPFMAPSFEQKKQEAEDAIKVALIRRIEDVSR